MNKKFAKHVANTLLTRRSYLSKKADKRFPEIVTLEDAKTKLSELGVSFDKIERKTKTLGASVPVDVFYKGDEAVASLFNVSKDFLFNGLWVEDTESSKSIREPHDNNTTPPAVIPEDFVSKKRDKFFIDREDMETGDIIIGVDQGSAVRFMYKGKIYKGIIEEFVGRDDDMAVVNAVVDATEVL